MPGQLNNLVASRVDSHVDGLPNLGSPAPHLDTHNDVHVCVEENPFV